MQAHTAALAKVIAEINNLEARLDGRHEVKPNSITLKIMRDARTGKQMVNGWATISLRVFASVDEESRDKYVAAD